MKNKYFYIAVTAVTILLCLPGCNEANNLDNPPAAAAESSDISYDTDNDTKIDYYYYSGQSPSETTVSTLTPLQTFERITKLKKDTAEGNETEKSAKNTDKKTDEEAISPKDTDITGGWFSAHTMFKINTIEEDSRFDGTWYRFPSDENNDTTSSAVVKSDRFNIDISENENNE